MAPTAVIVVAAGSGTRLARPEPKAFVPLAGRSILQHCLDGVAGAAPAQLVVVVPPSHLGHAQELLGGSAAVVPGGATRQLSVAAGLAAVGDDIDIVLVHDAARALAPAALFERVIAEVRRSGAGVVPGLPLVDTIKSIAFEGSGADGLVAGTLDRSALRAVQTPQGFPCAALRAAYAIADRDFTDDAALYAAAGHPVRVIEGDPRAFKITTGADLRRAETALGAGRPTVRTGIGIDAHAFDDSVPLWLGGLSWPGEPGLAGHSDGDAISHAICDALLSAAGLGDLGQRFGTADERYSGARGEVFIAETLALIAGAGYRVGNVSVQVIAVRPRIAARRAELEDRLSALVGAPVSVSATTSDGLGATGRGEGLCAVATALIFAE